MVTKQQVQKTVSPFSISLDAEVEWQTMSSKEVPVKNGLLLNSPKQDEVLRDLSIIGLIGSAQYGKLYFNINTYKKKAQKALDLQILKKHQLIRNKSAIPIYTLGATGMVLAGLDYEAEANKWKLFSKNDVLQRLVFFQLYEQFKIADKDVFIETAEEPFIASINRQGKSFAVLVLRGNEEKIKQFFRYNADKLPTRILIVTEEFTHLQPIMQFIKPYLGRIRVTTDHELKNSIKDMFYLYNEQEWKKDSVN